MRLPGFEVARLAGVPNRSISLKPVCQESDSDRRLHLTGMSQWKSRTRTMSEFASSTCENNR